MLQNLTSYWQKFCAVLFIFVFTTEFFSQERVYNFDEIVVTAGRTASRLSEVTRNIHIIKPEDIASSPVSNIQDLLQYVAGVDIKQRGVEGVQADVSIRGGTFEQTLIMIDGIKVSDPQTAHHNLNLPISLDQVERIEILKGTVRALLVQMLLAELSISSPKKGMKKVQQFSFPAVNTDFMMLHYRGIMVSVR